MRRIALTTCLAGLLLGATTGPAGAATLTPTSADFGSQPVGGISAPKAFTLTPDLLDALQLTITTTGEFKQTNNCAATLQVLSGPCTINVTFTPTAAGNHGGVLNTTTLLLGGPSATLRGSATGTGNDARAGTKCKTAGKKKKKKKGKKRAVVSKKKKKGKKKRKGCKKKKGKKKRKGKKK